MNTLTDARCCNHCWHSSEKPCPDVLACLVEGPKCHTHQECTEKQTKRAKRLRRETLKKTVVYVGAGTCGLGAGAAKTLLAVKLYLARKGIDAEIIEVGCIGLCSAEPLMDVHVPGRTRISFQHVSGADVDGLLESVFTGDVGPSQFVLGQFRQDGLDAWDGIPFMDEHPFFKPQTRWVLEHCGIVDPISIDEYIARGGYRTLADILRTKTPAEVCDDVERAGLRGRGGGGFPTGTKWKIALAQESGDKYIVCNADEGDPGAFMDRAVIEGDPHRMIEGMAIAAYGIAARHGYVYIRAEYPLAIKRLRQAIAQAEDYGLLGTNILDSGFSLHIKIKKGAGAFVCGEETALIHSIEGKRGMPRPRPPFPAVQGVFGKPTIINNVETLANLPGLMRRGWAAFAALGTPTSNGTKVFALSGKVVRTGLVEVAMGTPLRSVVFDIGGGIPNEKRFKAVQIGGPSGGCIPDQHMDIQVDYESIKTVGAMMGSGGLVVMDEDTCMVDVAKFFMEFIQRESCGKCIPCREGTLRLLESLQRITRGRRGEKGNDALQRFQSVMYMTRLAEVIKDTSLCGLGQTAPNPVLSTLRWFRDEYEAHIYERRCPAGVCTELRTFRIEADACTGCGSCKPKCPTNAIVGVRDRIHYIIDDQCIGCGACRDVCNHDAVLHADMPRPAVAALHEDDAIEGLFGSGAFHNWHDGKGLVRMKKE
ncbi:MAG: NADH dehydrogenase [Candidatus Hydrogenedentota bacterium]